MSSQRRMGDLKRENTRHEGNRVVTKGYLPAKERRPRRREITRTSRPTRWKMFFFIDLSWSQWCSRRPEGVDLATVVPR
jgi:hypothetical protein